MAEYAYKNVIVKDLPVLQVKIESLLGIMPKGITDAENVTTVLFSDEITAQQKALLDQFMEGSNLDVIPENIDNTNYLVAPPETILAGLGLEAAIFPTEDGLVFQFKKPLTDVEKDKLVSAFVATLKPL